MVSKISSVCGKNKDVSQFGGATHDLDKLQALMYTH